MKGKNYTVTMPVTIFITNAMCEQAAIDHAMMSILNGNKFVLSNAEVNFSSARVEEGHHFTTEGNK